MTVYHQPLGRPPMRHSPAFAQLTDGAAAGATTLAVQGRCWRCRRRPRGARSAFADLCARVGRRRLHRDRHPFPHRHHRWIPLMTPEERNEARRFMTQIDAFYEHKTNLICAAADAPDKLYVGGDGVREFKRTASRLIEMQSMAYLARPHLT
jgi:cell division protein ZapE